MDTVNDSVRFHSSHRIRQPESHSLHPIQFGPVPHQHLDHHLGHAWSGALAVTMMAADPTHASAVRRGTEGI
jgi:hypothetical protein